MRLFYAFILTDKKKCRNLGNGNTSENTGVYFEAAIPGPERLNKRNSGAGEEKNAQEQRLAERKKDY